MGWVQLRFPFLVICHTGGRTRSRSPGPGCGEGAPDFARMLTGTNSSRIISDTFRNKHLATMLVTRTDFEDAGDVGRYMSSGQKCLEFY